MHGQQNIKIKLVEQLPYYFLGWTEQNVKNLSRIDYLMRKKKEPVVRIGTARRIAVVSTLCFAFGEFVARCTSMFHSTLQIYSTSLIQTFVYGIKTKSFILNLNRVAS